MRKLLSKGIEKLGTVRNDLNQVQKNIDQALRLQKTLPEWEKQKEFLLGKEQELIASLEDLQKAVGQEKPTEKMVEKKEEPTKKKEKGK